MFFLSEFVEVRFDPSAKLAAWCPSVFGGPLTRHCTPQPCVGSSLSASKHCTTLRGAWRGQ